MDDLISRQAAIDALIELTIQRDKWDDKEGFAQKRGIDAAICAIEDLPSAERRGRWIPVTEKLPEEICDSYWVCTDSGYQCECRWTNINPFWANLTTAWHWNIFDIPQYSTVVAWMPLPEPYKGGEEE